MCFRAVRELTGLAECPERREQRYASSFPHQRDIIIIIPSPEMIAANVANVTCAGRQRVRRTPGAARREGAQGESRLSSATTNETGMIAGKAKKKKKKEVTHGSVYGPALKPGSQTLNRMIHPVYVPACLHPSRVSLLSSRRVPAGTVDLW